MENEQKLKKGLYFVHGYYMSNDSEQDTSELFRDQMILLRDSFDYPYDIEAYDVNIRDMRLSEQTLPQGEFVYYDGENINSAENDPTSVMHAELNKQLIGLIGYENYGNIPSEISDDISDVHSFHVNVGHGNCSIIVFCENKKYNMWMVDCSVFDFINRENYSENLDYCMEHIYNQFGIKMISKLLITHLHYDHINGIDHLIDKGWIDFNTEVWMNTQYPWKQPTYNRILLRLKSLGVSFIDPVIGNSTRHINVLYPNYSFNSKNKAPRDNINNASVLYQICLNKERMLFTGDIETEGWENVQTCMPYLNTTTYYCISHHGSITGHLGKGCQYVSFLLYNLSQCARQARLQILMGRNGAYRGIYSKKVLSSFREIRMTEKAEHFIEINWFNSSCKIK